MELGVPDPSRDVGAQGITHVSVAMLFKQTCAAGTYRDALNT